MKAEKIKLLVVYTVVALAWAEVLLVLTSWLLSATMTGGVRSLLSSEGVRWFFGSFTTMLASPILVSLLLLSMAGGCLWQSGIIRKIPNRKTENHKSTVTYRERVALRSVVALTLLYVAIIVMLTAIPHAMLLSATGRLFPSPFSHALVPIVAFGVITVSSIYGIVSGRFASLADTVSSLSFGIAKAAPLFLIYILAIQFYESLRFVFL